MNNTFKKRIDELGRIVIPKQIRNTFKIKDFDELELYIENDNIIIKKTGGILLIKEKLDNFLNFIKKYNNIAAIIIDKNEIISTNIYDINSNLISIDNLINNQDYVEINTNGSLIKGYKKTYQLIYDSVLYGTVIFIVNNKLSNVDVLKDVVNLLLDYIR